MWDRYISRNYYPEKEHTYGDNLTHPGPRFDKDIPEDFGNAEYRQERELLIAINYILALGDLEDPVNEYFLDVVLYWFSVNWTNPLFC